MTPKGFLNHVNDAKKDASQLEKLIRELDYIKNDIETITKIDISDEAKAPAIAELEKQIAEVKERMHNAIDEL